MSAADPHGSAYRRFWADVGVRFPDLGGAASTRLYAENERRLFSEHLAPLGGVRLLKTDLWDEAKNTRILAWASRHGALAYGLDISLPTVVTARQAFGGGPERLRGVAADIRAVPFADASFDAIYSMGTIEHFEETERAIAEMARVLRPGGRAIVGVPNRWDPFLRPLLATVLQALGLYAYGYEKSYTRRALREMLERAGLTVVAETAILFIPGWLRMLDLACHSWCRPLARVTGVLVWPFLLLDRHVPAVRRYGYLLATVVIKPGAERDRRRGVNAVSDWQRRFSSRAESSAKWEGHVEERAAEILIDRPGEQSMNNVSQLNSLSKLPPKIFCCVASSVPIASRAAL